MLIKTNVLLYYESHTKLYDCSRVCKKFAFTKIHLLKIYNIRGQHELDINCNPILVEKRFPNFQN